MVRSRRVWMMLGLVLALASSMLCATPALAGGNDAASCVPAVDPAKSVARLWNEALLDAIRRDFPAPTVHARNLYHVSAVMWDAWAAYDPVADGVFVTDEGRPRPSGRGSASAPSAMPRIGCSAIDIETPWAVPTACVSSTELMASLCYPTDRTGTKGDSAAALGNRIAKRTIAAGLQGRLARAAGLHVGRLRARQRTHGGSGTGHVPDRPRPLAASGPRGRDLAERPAAAQRAAAVRRTPLGPCRFLRSARCGSRRSTHRPGSAASTW